jgi:hypothetical protein
MMMMINLFICVSAHVTIIFHNTVDYSFPSVRFLEKVKEIYLIEFEFNLSPCECGVLLITWHSSVPM